MPDKKIEIRVEAQANTDAVKVLDNSLSSLEKRIDSINQKQEVLFVEPTAKLDAMLDRVSAVRRAETPSLATKPPSLNQSEADAIRLRGEAKSKPTVPNEPELNAESGSGLYSLLRVAGVRGYETLGRLGVKLAAIAVAFRASKSAIEEFAASEQSLAKLDAALSNNGQSTDKLRASVVGLAQQMSQASGESMTKWVDALRELVQVGGAPVENLNKYAEGVKNLSALMGGDTARASQVMARALQGNFESLKQFGIQSADTGDTAQSLNKLLAELASKGAAQAQAMEGTLTASWNSFKGALTDAGAATGGLLTKLFGLNTVVKALGLIAMTTAGVLTFLGNAIGLVTGKTEAFVSGLRGAVDGNKDAATATLEHKAALEQLKVATETQKEALAEEEKRLGIVVGLERQKIEVDKQLALEVLKRDTLTNPSHRADNELKAAIIESKSKEQVHALTIKHIDEQEKLKSIALHNEEERQKKLEAQLAAANREQLRNTYKNYVKSFQDEQLLAEQDLRDNGESPSFNDAASAASRRAIEKRIADAKANKEAELARLRGVGSSSAIDRQIAPGLITGNAETDAASLKAFRETVQSGRINLGGLKSKTAEEITTLELDKQAKIEERQGARAVEKSEQQTKRKEHVKDLEIAAEERHLHELERRRDKERDLGRAPVDIDRQIKLHQQLLNRMRAPNEITRLDEDESADAKFKSSVKEDRQNSRDKLGKTVLTPLPTQADNTAAITKALQVSQSMQDKQAKAVQDAFVLSATAALNATNEIKMLDIKFRQLLNP